MNINPFRGWRYRTATGDISRLVAPPYDILSADDKARLLAADPHNIVAVDLPHVPPKEAGSDAEYASAADTLRRWQREGVLVQEDRPCLYAYEQAFAWAGRSYVRRALVAAVRLEEFCARHVWPHEKTFPGPKADRLKLTQATRMQLSPIFGFYEDDGSVAAALFAAAQRGGTAGAAHATLRGARERFLPVSEPAVIEQVKAALADRNLFIADGHHRYTTCLNYRQSLGDLPADHPANFVLFVLAAMDDPGLVILPTHRVIRGLDDFDLDGFINSTRRVIEYTPVEVGEDDLADASAYLRPHGSHAMLFLSAKGGRVQAAIGRLKDVSLMKKVAPEETEAWRRLDVSILHTLIIEHFLADCRRPETSIEYYSDGKAPYAAALGRGGTAEMSTGQAQSGPADLAVFLQCTPVASVKEIALSRAVMPHKSTYFYPKPATGLVLYQLA